MTKLRERGARRSSFICVAGRRLVIGPKPSGLRGMVIHPRSSFTEAISAFPLKKDQSHGLDS
jgi:hypothetical protein